MPSIFDPGYLLVGLCVLLLIRWGTSRAWPLWSWPLALVLWPLMVAWAVEMEEQHPEGTE